MPGHTLKAAAGAAFFTLIFFLLIAFQPAPARDVFAPDDASAAAISRDDRAAAQNAQGQSVAMPTVQDTRTEHLK